MFEDGTWCSKPSLTLRDLCTHVDFPYKVWLTHFRLTWCTRVIPYMVQWRQWSPIKRALHNYNFTRSPEQPRALEVRSKLWSTLEVDVGSKLWNIGSKLWSKVRFLGSDRSLIWIPAARSVARLGGSIENARELHLPFEPLFLQSIDSLFSLQGTIDIVGHKCGVIPQ